MEKYNDVKEILKIADSRERWKKVCELDDYFARYEVLMSIHDNELLKEIALSKTDGMLAIDAAERINDQRILAEIALKRNVDYRVRLKAISYLENDEALSELALRNDDDSKIRLRAIEQLDDGQEALW